MKKFLIIMLLSTVVVSVQASEESKKFKKPCCFLKPRFKSVCSTLSSGAMTGLVAAGFYQLYNKTALEMSYFVGAGLAFAGHAYFKDDYGPCKVLEMPTTLFTPKNAAATLVIAGAVLYGKDHIANATVAKALPYAVGAAAGFLASVK